MTEPTPNDESTTEPQEGRIVINKIYARIVNNYGKIITGAAVVIASIFGYNYFYKPTGNKGIYDNKPATFMTSEKAQNKNIAWVVRNGFNQYACYGMGDYMDSSPSLVSRYILKLRREGVKDIYFIYSRSSSVTGTLDSYQRKQTNDSCKFSGTLSEIEQYNTGKRPEFYATIKEVYNYNQKHGLTSAVYQGHFNQADIDTIIKYTDRLFNHAYLEYDKKKDLGGAVFGYQRSRFNAIVMAMDKKYPKDLTKKYNVETIFSCENPDTTKQPDGKYLTQFGFKYFTTHTWEDPYSEFIGYWNLHATSDMKRRIQLGGSMLFVGEQAKQIKK